MNSIYTESLEKVSKENKPLIKQTYSNLDLDVFFEEIKINSSRSNTYNLQKDWINFTHSLCNDMFLKSFK